MERPNWNCFSKSHTSFSRNTTMKLIWLLFSQFPLSLFHQKLHIHFWLNPAPKGRIFFTKALWFGLSFGIWNYSSFLLIGISRSFHRSIFFTGFSFFTFFLNGRKWSRFFFSLFQRCKHPEKKKKSFFQKDSASYGTTENVVDLNVDNQQLGEYRRHSYFKSTHERMDWQSICRCSICVVSD